MYNKECWKKVKGKEMLELKKIEEHSLNKEKIFKMSMKTSSIAVI